jgi:hypothetical protein
MAKQKATQAYIAEFKNAREEWKVRERQRMEEENIKIRDFARIQQLRESERMQNKKAKEESIDIGGIDDYHCLKFLFIIQIQFINHC